MIGMNPYLNFNGNCAEAFRFYHELFGAAEPPQMMPFGEMPSGEMPPLPESVQGKIMHAALQVGSVMLMGTDAIDMPGMPESAYHKPQGMAVSIHVEDAHEAERLFAALSEGGSVQMPIGETFWAQRFGMCTDRFGIPWMINCDKAHSA